MNDLNTNSLLLHACCGPCSTWVWQQLAKEYPVVTAFFYNPNIQPIEEFEKRLLSMQKVANYLGGTVLIDHSGREVWLDRVSKYAKQTEGGYRCHVCISIRLEKTFETAKKENYKTVTTTLSVSRHKNSKMIMEIGNKLADKFGIEFLSRDFKKKNGYAISQNFAKEWNLYMQQYCGCLFSRNP